MSTMAVIALEEEAPTELWIVEWNTLEEAFILSWTWVSAGSGSLLDCSPPKQHLNFLRCWERSLSLTRPKVEVWVKLMMV